MEKWADLLLFESSRKVPNLALLALFLQSLCPHFTIPWKRSDAVIYAVNKWTYMWSNLQDISKMTEVILNLLDDKLNLNELNMSFSSLLTKQIYPSMDPRQKCASRPLTDRSLWISLIHTARRCIKLSSREIQFQPRKTQILLGQGFRIENSDVNSSIVVNCGEKIE